MAQEIKTQWEGQMLFNADTLGGNFKIDAAEESGGQGKGVRPKALMLTSLAGCTGMDIVSLLKKMRAEVDDLDINVSGELTEKHPKIYNKVTLEYVFYGEDLKKDKIEKAIQLSAEKYCGVMEMFKQFAEITTVVSYKAKKSS
ncbi:OsmC family protein [Lutimonas sp.]|uniref:OsmC family protein n=1 Tax=Lutimonas sp. TaxID=1872403 RepID=UPI003D9B1BE6